MFSPKSDVFTKVGCFHHCLRSWPPLPLFLASTASVPCLTGTILDLTGTVLDLTGTVLDLTGTVFDLTRTVFNLSLSRDCV